MAADDAALCFADSFLPRNIGRFARNKPGKAREMSRFSSRLCQHLHDIRKRAFGLRDKIVTDEFPTLAPANLAGDEDLASLGGHAVGIAFGRQPILWLKKFECVLAHG